MSDQVEYELERLKKIVAIFETLDERGRDFK